jgi:hypothetical protein
MHAHEGLPGEQEPGCDMLPTLGVGGSACTEKDSHQVNEMLTEPIAGRYGRQGQPALRLGRDMKENVLGVGPKWHVECLTGVATTCNPGSDVSSSIWGSFDACRL